jgi:methyl-accepting chemotaxis protein
MVRVPFFEDLSIGKKIALGFGLTGFLFLLVVWQYHQTLFQALANSDHLQSVYGAKKYHSLNIHRYMLEARRSEKDFLARKQPEYVERVKQYVDLVLAEAAASEGVEETDEGRELALRIQDLMLTYHEAFQKIVEAWQRKGLNHDSGLQGQFRKTIHDVEEKARDFATSALYFTLLQIRRAEKDLGLRLNEEYIVRVRRLGNLFHEQVQESSLDSQARSTLANAMDSYLRHFEIYAKRVMEGKEIKGGKGPFRDVAHQLEGYLQKRYVPDLEINILTLRRWEKDYLLRRDEQYVEMVKSAVKSIHDNITSSQLSMENKKILTGLIDRYKKDFLALVEENDRIITLTARMRNAVHKIEPLVAANVQGAIMHMERETEEIRATSREKAFLAISLSLVALLTAIFFAVVITRRITVPLFTLLRVAEIHTGDEMVSEDVGHKDEVRALAAAMGRMDGALTMTYARLYKEVESLDRCVAELSRISNEMASEARMETFGNAVRNQADELGATVAEVKAILLRVVISMPQPGLAGTKSK